MPINTVVLSGFIIFLAIVGRIKRKDKTHSSLVKYSSNLMNSRARSEKKKEKSM